MKHKEKRLEDAHQYQTMSTKEWRKVVFSDEKKFKLDSLDGFQKYWHAKNFSCRELLSDIEENLLGSGMKFTSSGKLKLQFFSSWQKAVDYVKMLNDLSLAPEGRRRCGEEWIFQQNNAAIHNASITKKYLLEQKNKTSWPPNLLSRPRSYRKFEGISSRKVYERGQQYSGISELKNAILDA